MKQQSNRFPICSSFNALPVVFSAVPSGINGPRLTTSLDALDVSFIRTNLPYLEDSIILLVRYLGVVVT